MLVATFTFERQPRYLHRTGTRWSVLDDRGVSRGTWEGDSAAGCMDALYLSSDVCDFQLLTQCRRREVGRARPT